MIINTDDWRYYYKLTQHSILAESNLLYTPTISPDGSMMCMHYCIDKTYRSNTPDSLAEELVDWFFRREVRFLKEFAHFDFTPTIYEIDLISRKIIIEWNTETLSQIVFNPDRSLDRELPDWQEQIKNILINTKKFEHYKMSLYPHCFFISKEGKLKTIDYYAVVPYNERFIERHIIEGVIGSQGAYRFDESTDNGRLDFKKFFEITLTQHLKNYWPTSLFSELFEEIYK
jgi:hypothetical protein